MKNLLITGGTGFFGRALLRYIDSVKRTNDCLPFDQITVMSRSPESFLLKHPSFANFSWLSWHKGDVLLPSSLPRKGNFYYILHAASDSTDSLALKPLDIYRQIVDGTENMLKFATTHGVQRFLFTSSGAAYGPQPAEMELIPETFNGMPDPLNPINAYGVAKRICEHLCAHYTEHYGLETIIARCFAFVGEDLPRHAHFAIGNFIRDALERSAITVNGNGMPIRSYMHQSDLAKWILTLLQNGRNGNAYNVGSDDAISILDLASLVRDILSPEKKVMVRSEYCLGEALRNRYVPDINKAKIEMGLGLTVNINNAIRLSGAR
jgi:UDP-glucuronate decarboxylase